jgi:hypothetical protein
MDWSGNKISDNCGPIKVAANPTMPADADAIAIHETIDKLNSMVSRYQHDLNDKLSNFENIRQHLKALAQE